MRIEILIPFVLLLLIAGCSYEFNENTLLSVEEPGTGDLEAVLLTTDEDTIYLTEKAQTRFELDLNYEGPGSFAGISVWMNDNQLMDKREWSYFILYNVNHPPGTYKLKVVVHYRSASKSLLNQVQPQYEEYEYAWTVIRDITPPDPVDLSYEVVDGKLKLTWTTPNKKNFDYFMLSKAYNGRSVELDREATSYVDNAFVGGIADYRLEIKTPSFSVESKLLEEIPGIDSAGFEWLGRNSIKVFWEKPTFYENVEATKITFFDDVESEGVMTSATLNVQGYLQFGTEYITQLKLFANEQDEFYHNSDYTQVIPVFLGLRFNPFIRIFKSSYALQSVFTLANYYNTWTQSLVRIGIDGEIEAVYTGKNSPVHSAYQLSVSSDGQLACFVSNQDHHLYILDPLTLEENKKINLNDITGEPYGFYPRKIQFLNDYRLVVELGNHTYLIDLDNQDVLFRAEKRGQLSANEEFFIVPRESNFPSVNDYYRVTNGLLEHLFQEAERTQVQFAGDSKIVYLVQGANQHRLQCHDMSLDINLADVPLTDIQAPKILNVDTTNEHLVVRGVYKIYVIDYAKGSIVYEGSGRNQGKEFIFDGHLISDNGFKINIDELKELQ